MPIWVLLEVGSFGTLVDFYRFCAKRWDSRKMMREYYRLKQVKVIRNSTAHSSCIINGFGIGETTPIRLGSDVEHALSETSIGKKARKARLRNPRIQQMVTLFYTYNEFVGDKDAMRDAKDSMAAFFEQVDKNAGYYKKNSLIRSSFDFLNRLFDNWF
jgi:hypothetical protein